MSVGLLIVSHNNIGSSMLQTAIDILEICPLNTECLSVAPYSVTEHITHQAQGMIEQLDQGDGILILTDIFGATPSNIACRLQAKQIKMIAGLNLPMLLRILNYAQLSLDELASKALEGGQAGIIECSMHEGSITHIP